MPQNLTIDFNDASFDESSNDIQPVHNATVDVVFPVSDNANFITANAAEDHRSSTASPANSIALMPDQATTGALEEFLFEFDNSIDHDNNVNTPDRQGLKITTEGNTGSGDVITNIDLLGTFNNLTDGGTLDVHVGTGLQIDHDGNAATPKVAEFIKFSLGAPTANSGSDKAILVSGDTNGADMGDGRDMATINVDASADMTGLYKGGAGFDVLTLVEGVQQDNGAFVDFTKGVKNAGVTDVNSALVTNYGGEGSGLNFFISEFETLRLTDNADTIIIGADTGHGLTNNYDIAHMTASGSGSSSMSMLEVKSGFTDGGAADVMYINADSNIYLSFDFADNTNQGINATFQTNGDVNVDDLGGSGSTIDVDVIKGGGTGLAVDYLEGTENKDVVVNKGTIGVTVNLGGSEGDFDVFTGSAGSDHDILDAREAYDLTFTKEVGSDYIRVDGDSEVRSSAVKAEVKDVDYIMVRDQQFTGTFPHKDQGGVDALWSQITGNVDVDILKDMTHLNGTKLMGNLGDGATDAYGLGYDVMTSAEVYKFGTGAGSDNIRVYYEGDHDDFVDTDDNITVSRENGTVTMSSSSPTRGSGWEDTIAGQYGPGQAPGFYIEVSSKKLAVTFDKTKNEWKVDTTAIQVAESADTAISAESGSATSGTALANAVAGRFGIQLRAKEPNNDTTDHSTTQISNDIYLNATEEAITELLAGGVQSKSYNFDFYTKVDLKAEGGDVTVNVKLTELSGSFTLDFTDIDVGVESFHNVVGVDANPAAGIISSSAAGEFVKVDNSADIALGNGGNDTYVIGDDGSSIYGGVALEYGNIDTSGGLANSEADAVNFNSVTSVDDLTFRRGKYRNEEEGSTLFIGDSNSVQGVNETILFDNYNEYLDFRRVEYLTVEDGANNNEVYEIVTNTNLSDWDNEIYVADGGTSHVMVGGIDHMIGSDKADTVNLIFSDITGGAVDDLNNTIDLSGLTSADTVTIDADAAGDVIANQSDLETKLNAGIDSGTDGKATISYDYSANAVTVTYDNVDGTTYDFTKAPIPYP
jgi:hypothetical protein